MRLNRRMVIGLVSSALFLGLLIARTDLQETWDALKEANYAYVVPAIALSSFGTLWIRAMRWRYLLRPLAETQTTRLYPLVTVGYMVNNLLPVRAGEVVRAYLVGRHYGISRMAALATIALERVFDGTVLVGLLIVGGAIVGLNSTLRNLEFVMAGAYVLAVSGLFAVALSERWSERLAHRALGRLPQRARGRASDLATSFLIGLRSLRSPSTLTLVLGASLATWLLDTVTYYLMGRAFGIDESFAVFMVVAAVANLAISVPSSQGGVGPFEFFAREALVVAGVSAGVATAYSVALHAVLIIPVTLMGFLFVWLSDITLSNVMGRDQVEPEFAGGNKP